MAMGARGGRRQSRAVGAGARLAALIGALVIVGGIVAQPMLAPAPASPEEASPSPPAAPSAVGMDELLGSVRSTYFEIYDADQVPGTADDLTPAKLDLILEGAESADAAADVAILGLLTTVILDLTATELGAATDGDPICADGVVDVSSSPGARDVFGVDRPKVAGVVANVLGNWDGTLGNDGRTWTFRYEEAQKSTVLDVLEGMTAGRLIVESGCPS